ncbi:MAG: hypothetical protein L0H79_12820 [Intrasporangium sp.]|uniref:hypothetical protein n=1 Tax=Intrasporangium sp. TaxID=1925024 RepID=UPI002647145B|nr:hypothetical protein [Intrasporangium sp.]MDN5796623.1 hypothetical protein [Intrasporangium sp.]
MTTTIARAATMPGTTESTDPSPVAPGTTYTLPGISWLSLQVKDDEGTLTVGPCTVAVHLSAPAEGTLARVEADLSQVTLGALSAAAKAAGAADPLALLPRALAQAVSSVAVASAGASFDLAARTLVGFDLTVTAVPSWPLVPGHVVLDDLAVTLAASRSADASTFEVTASATLAGTAVSLTVTHDEPGTYGVSLSTVGERRLGAATVAAFVGDDLSSHLPSQLSGLGDAGLADAAVVLSADGLDSIAVTLSTGSPIPLPDPLAVTVQDISVHVAVQHPTDPAARTVDVSIGGTATFAGAAVVVKIERDPAATGAAAWSLHAGLAPGASLTVPAVATAYGLSVPNDLPELALTDCALDATLDGSTVTFSAASPTEWTVPVGPDGIGIGQIHVTFDRRPGHRAGAGSTTTGSVTGVIHLAGIVIPVTYAVPGGLSLHASIATVAPFALIQDVVGAATLAALTLPPELTALTMTDVVLAIDAEHAELSFAATGPGFKRVQAVVRKSTTWGFAVGIELDDDYRFSSLSPALAGLDTVHLPDALIIIASFDDTTFTFDELQPDAGKGVGKGAVIDGRLDLSGLGADKFLGEAHLDVKAEVGPSLADLQLEAAVGDITITDGVVLKDAELAVHPDPQNVSVSVSGAVDVTIDASPLQFVGGVSVVPNGISFFATMKGTWQDPFGAKGIALGNVSLQIGSDFEGVPSIGIAGGLTIGAFQGTAAVSFNSALPTQSVLIVAFNHLSLMDVLDTFTLAQVRAGIPADVTGTLTGISLEDVDLYVVPQDTTIGALSYKQGLRVGGKLHVAGLTAQADVEIDQQDGIKASGSLSPVVIGDVFSLTGTDQTKGPDLDLEITTSAVPKVNLDGWVSLLGLTAGASVSLMDSGFDFTCEGNVFGLFTAKVSANGGNLQSGPGFMVHADLQQDFRSDLARRAAAVLQQAGADAQAQIAAAQHDVDTAQAEVKRFTASVQSAEADLTAEQADAQAKIQALSAKVSQAQQALGAIDAQTTATRARIQAERDAAATHLRDLQRQLAAAQGPVSSLNAQIDSAQSQINQLNSDIAWWHNWYNNLAWYDKTWGWTKLGAEVGWRGAQVVALEASIQGLRGSLVAANAALQAAQHAVDTALAAQATYPIDQDPRLVALRSSRTAAQLALQGAQNALNTAKQAAAAAYSAASAALAGVQQQLSTATAALQTADTALTHLNQTVGDVAAVSAYIAAHGLPNLIEVRSASFTGTLQATSGGSVTLDVDLVFQGKQERAHLAYDFHDLTTGAKNLAEQVLPTLPS